MSSKISKLTVVTFYKSCYKNFKEKRLKTHLKDQLPLNTDIIQVNKNYKGILNFD